MVKAYTINKKSESGSPTNFLNAGKNRSLTNEPPFFSKTGTPPSFIQPRLTVGQPNDKYEKEADAMADKVVQRMANPSIQAKCAHCEEEEKKQNAIQRKCASCEKEDEQKLQPKPESSRATAAPPQIESSLNSSKGNGNPLPAHTKTQLENSFGTDFSNVRLHTDSASVQMNKDLHAQAFTHGSDIYFNAGKYNPESSAGKHLLAHELTHVVQQGLSSTNGASHTRNVIQRQSVATTCGKPSECPEDFCVPFSSSLEAQAVRAASAPILLGGIAAKVSPRVVPLWNQYLFGGTSPIDVSSDFGSDFILSQTTESTTTFLNNELKAELEIHPPAFLPGQNIIEIDIPTTIPAAVAEINTPGSNHEMNFNAIGEIPGNIAGGIGTTQLSCPVGAKPSPFNDSRLVRGKALVVLNPDNSLTVFPFFNYTVKDTIDLCPGNCGASIEQIATIPMSRLEASGISGDVPFTVNFSSLPVPPFTVITNVPVPAPTIPTPAALVTGTVTASSLRIRKGPFLSSAVIGSYPNGTRVNIICSELGSMVDANPTWYKTDRGFISGRYVSLNGDIPPDC